MGMVMPRNISEPQSNDFLLWARAYHVAAVAAVVLLAVLLAAPMTGHRQTIHGFEPERINPNTAPVGSLVRLPGIGKARALDIIHYRQSQAAGGMVFTAADDLQAIRGIGPKTTEKLAPWLTFEDGDKQ
jgi:DNA uptake protein ComE-like DNA-binding protein